MQLLLRSGPRQRPGWLRVDSDPSVRPDVLADGTELAAFGPGSARRVDAGDLLVHLDLPQARAALAEWRRVLAPKGELALEVPDLDAVVLAVGAGPADAPDPGLQALFGDPSAIDGGGPRAQRRSAWNRRLLERELLAAGLTTARIEATPEGTLRVSALAPADLAPAVTEGSPARTADGRRRYFAWPDYGDPVALARFFEDYAARLVGREGEVLVLGFDPERDGPRAAVVAALTEVHARVLGQGARLDVTLLDEPLDADGWRTVGRHLEARIALDRDVAWPAPLVMDCPVVATPAALGALLDDPAASAVSLPQPTQTPSPSTLTATAPAGAEGEPVSIDPSQLPGVAARPGIEPDPELIGAAAALHPWFYPVELAGHVVTPGLGSPCAPDWLRSRTVHRAQLMVRGVLSRVDVRGARVLDLASNCGFWSSYFARAGAAEVVGLEGRTRHVEQARLYWRSNGFLPEDRWRFDVGNVADSADWAGVRRGGPYDVTVVAGILYHVANYDEILRWAAAVTDGALLVDTRVQEGPEELVEEPGEMSFNAIDATRRKRVPNRERLLACLAELGLETEVLPVPFGEVLGLEDCDDYSTRRRVTVLARRPERADR